MSKKSTGNIDTCIFSARSFLGVSDIIDLSLPGRENFIRPFFVNTGLSCELFLKSIQMIEGEDNSFYTGHNLKDLFEALSKEKSSSIVDLYDDNYPKDKVKIELNDLLEKYPDPFVDFRYTFENSAEGNWLGLQTLARSLNAYLISLGYEDCKSQY